MPRAMFALLALLLAAGPSFATESVRILDDVEIFPHLPFSNTGQNIISWQHSGIPEASCLSTNRTFCVFPGASTQLTSGNADDWIVIQNLTPTAGLPVFSVEYNFAVPVDLTFGGDHDRFRLLMAQWAEGPVNMIAEVEWAGGVPGTPDGSVGRSPAATQNTILFSEFGMPGGHWSAISAVRFRFEASSVDPVDSRLYRIQLVGGTVESGGPYVASQDDGTFYELTPVPPPPYEVEWTWTDPSGGPYEMARTEVGLLLARVGPNIPYPGELVMEYGPYGSSSVNMTVHSTAPDIPGGTFFVSLDYVPTLISPELFYPPDEVHGGEKLMVFNIHTVLKSPLNPAVHGGHLYQRLSFEIPEGSPLQFDSAMIDAFTGGNNVTLDLRLDRLAGPVYGPGVAFSMNVQTDWRPEDTSTAVTRPTVLLPQLSARPSVLSASTDFWLEQSLNRSLQVGIFDARGRQVSEFWIPAGMRSLSWSANDRRGASLASGRYYARIAGVSAPGVTLTVIR